VREEIAKTPSDTTLHASLALYLAKSGDKAAALQELKQVGEGHSKDPSVLYSSAVAYELSGNRKKALESLLAAVKAGQGLDDVKNDPDLVALRADPQYHLAMADAFPAKSSR
jgi:Flp pilus assembly protein TadD